MWSLFALVHPRRNTTRRDHWSHETSTFSRRVQLSSARSEISASLSHSPVFASSLSRKSGNLPMVKLGFVAAATGAQQQLALFRAACTEETDEREHVGYVGSNARGARSLPTATQNADPQRLWLLGGRRTFFCLATDTGPDNTQLGDMESSHHRQNAWPMSALEGLCSMRVPVSDWRAQLHDLRCRMLLVVCDESRNQVTETSDSECAIGTFYRRESALSDMEHALDVQLLRESLLSSLSHG